MPHAGRVQKQFVILHCFQNNALGRNVYSQGHLMTITYAKFEGQTGCSTGDIEAAFVKFSL